MPLRAFHPAVRTWFEEAFREPTPAQLKGWAAIARGESTLLLAPTGSGKTLAAFLWCLNRLMFEPEPPPRERCRVLYVSPLKALAVDVERNLRAPIAGVANAAARLNVPFRVPSLLVRTGDTPGSARARFQRDPADIVITTTGNKDIITLSHMKRMKDKAIVGNIGHFDNEIDMAGLARSGAKRVNVKPQYDEWVFPAEGGVPAHSVLVLAEGRLLNLGCATGHPSFVMSSSFTNQVLAQLDLHFNATGQPTLSGTRYDARRVYILPKKLDEDVARLHLDKLGVKLTKLTSDQAEYIGVDVDGPFKSAHYRY